MKLSFSLLMILGFLSNLSGQTAFGVSSLAKPSNDQNAVGAFNPWFGATLGNSILGEGDLGNGIFTTGQFMLPLKIFNNEDVIRTPLVTNIAQLKSEIDFSKASELVSALTDLASDETGLMLGIHPAYKLPTDANISIFGELGGKWNILTDDSTDVNSNIVQIRYGLGLEFGFIDLAKTNIEKEGNRFIVNIAALWGTYNTGELERFFEGGSNTNFHVEISAFYGLNESTAIMLEYSIGDQIESPLDIGVIYSLETK